MRRIAPALSWLLPLVPTLAWILALSWPAAAGPGDVVYHLTAHGDTASGVFRDGTYPVGTCRQCHSSRALPGARFAYGLFADPDNGLCFDCHAVAGVAAEYLGQPAFESSNHWLSGDLLWPGPDPQARGAGDEGLCLNCHTPHGRRDGAGLVPVQGVAREEALCVACHDADGPAATDVDVQIGAADAHPVIAVSDVHDVGEGLDAAAFGVGARHVECTDCHNPHAAEAGLPLEGVSRIAVMNGVALSVPTYVERLGDDPAPVEEYEICFKCHSSWTTLPVGARDLATELNPANASYHPIEAAGTNATAAMQDGLADALGAPTLTVDSTITCSDCHGSEQLPTDVTVMSSYVGVEPAGPHGSDAAPSDDYSRAVLRAQYRTELKPRGEDYARNDFELCFVCHSPEPFERGGMMGGPTNFRRHRLHVEGIGNEGDGAGDIMTPGAGRGNGICRECHYSLHGIAGAYFAGDRANSRLLSFSPNVTGPDGDGAPSWSPRSCTLRCHGKRHRNMRY